MTKAMNSNYHLVDLIEQTKHREPIEAHSINHLNLIQRDTNGRNALYWAIKNQSKHNVVLLIKKKVSLMVQSNVHALFHTVESNNLEALVYLLKLGLNIHLQDNDGKTLLMKAIEKNSFIMVQYLINYGSDLDLMDNNYDMAIDHAHRLKNKKIIELIHYKSIYEASKVSENDCSGCGFGYQNLCADKKKI